MGSALTHGNWELKHTLLLSFPGTPSFRHQPPPFRPASISQPLGQTQKWVARIQYMRGSQTNLKENPFFLKRRKGWEAVASLAGCQSSSLERLLPPPPTSSTHWGAEDRGSEARSIGLGLVIDFTNGS